jgi:hypothetical protein
MMFAPTCAAQDEGSFAAAEAYADEGDTRAYAEAYASGVEVNVSTDLDAPDEIDETAEAQPQEIYYQFEPSQNQAYTQQARLQTRSVADNNTEQANTAEETAAKTDEIAVKVGTIAQLADDTIKQTDIIEKQNAKTLSLFLVALGTIALILILTIANLITQRRIKNKLLQNA